MAVRRDAVGAKPKPQGPRLTKGERTRARLVESAEQAFGEGTYDEASIVDITRRAGVSQGTFYLYFPAKIDIFREVVLHLGHQVRSSIAAAVEGAGSRAEVERRGFEAFFGFVQDHPNLYRIIRQAEFVDRDIYRRHYERIADGYVAGLTAAMATGEFRKLDPEVVAYCLMGMGELVGARWILWGDGKQKIPRKVLDSLVDFVIGALAKS